jgi:hypothetical protein
MAVVSETATLLSSPIERERAARNTMTLGALSRAQAAFIGRVRSVVLKGGALLAYGVVAPGARHLDDIDLWVRPRDASAAWDLLIGAGFRPVSSTPSSTHAGIDSLDAPTHQLPMLRSPHGALLELHLESHASGDAGDFDACWAAGRDVDVFGSKVRVPSLPHLLEQVCAHVVVHHFGDLRYWPRHVDDINAILRAAPELAAWRERPDEVGLSLRVAHGAAHPQRADAALSRLFLDPGPMTRAAWQAAATAVRAGRFARQGPRGLVDAVVPSAAHLRFTAHARRWRRLARRSLRALERRR